MVTRSTDSRKLQLLRTLLLLGVVAIVAAMVSLHSAVHMSTRYRGFDCLEYRKAGRSRSRLYTSALLNNATNGLAARPPPRQQPAHPLFITPAPRVDVARVLQEAAAKKHSRLARTAQLLAQHRVLTSQHADSSSIAAARAAYRQALGSFLGTGEVAAAGGFMPAWSAPSQLRTASTQPSVVQQGQADSHTGADAGEAAAGEAAATAAAIISEGLSAVQDAAAIASTRCDGQPAILPCSSDPSLPRSLPPGKRLLIASNLRDSEAIMPNFLVQLLRLALLEGGGGSGHGDGGSGGGGDEDGGAGDGARVFVQIYESNSTDETGARL